MSFFSDLAHGNFGNLWHDVESQVVDHPLQTLGYLGAAAGTALTAGALGPELFGGAAALEGGGALAAEGFGGAALAEGTGLFGAEAAGGTALEGLGFAGTEGGLAGAEGVGAINSAMGGASGFEGLAGEPAMLGAGEESLSGFASQGGNVGSGLGGGGSAAAGGGSASGEGGFLNSVWQGAKSSVANNPLGIGAAGVGLGLNMLKGNPDDPNRTKLQDSANQLGAQGQQLQQYLMTGTLPPALQASMNQATQAAKARIVSNHAKNGMPTDPSQNSALAQELNSVDMNAVAAMATAELDMMKTGLSATGLSTQLYEMLVKMDRQSNQDLMSAISSFASALGGGGKGVQLKLA